MKFSEFYFKIGKLVPQLQEKSSIAIQIGEDTYELDEVILEYKKTREGLIKRHKTYIILKVGNLTSGILTKDISYLWSKSNYKSFFTDTPLRVMKCLKTLHCETIEDITKLTSKEILAQRGVGRKTYNEIRYALKDLGLSLTQQ